MIVVRQNVFHVQGRCKSCEHRRIGRIGCADFAIRSVAVPLKQIKVIVAFFNTDYPADRFQIVQGSGIGGIGNIECEQPIAATDPGDIIFDQNTDGVGKTGRRICGEAAGLLWIGRIADVKNQHILFEKTGSHKGVRFISGNAAGAGSRSRSQRGRRGAGDIVDFQCIRRHAIGGSADDNNIVNGFGIGAQNNRRRRHRDIQNI